jgi:hypothetical protein
MVVRIQTADTSSLCPTSFSLGVIACMPAEKANLLTKVMKRRKNEREDSQHERVIQIYEGSLTSPSLKSAVFRSCMQLYVVFLLKHVLCSSFAHSSPLALSAVIEV